MALNLHTDTMLSTGKTFSLLYERSRFSSPGSPDTTQGGKSLSSHIESTSVRKLGATSHVSFTPWEYCYSEKNESAMLDFNPELINIVTFAISIPIYSFLARESHMIPGHGVKKCELVYTIELFERSRISRLGRPLKALSSNCNTRTS